MKILFWGVKHQINIHSHPGKSTTSPLPCEEHIRGKQYTSIQVLFLQYNVFPAEQRFYFVSFQETVFGNL